MRAEDALEVLDRLYLCLNSSRCEHDECHGCNLSTPSSKTLDALDRALEALERDEPISTGIAESGYIPCGNCGGAVEEHWDYCPWCGQRRKE